MIWTTRGENIVQESSRLPRFSLRLNPEPEVSPPWHSRPEDDRGDGAEAPPHGEGSLSRLCPPKNCYASLTLRMSGHYRKPSTDNGILGKDEPKMFYRTLVDAWGRLITDSSRLTSSREQTPLCVEPVTDRIPNSRTCSTLVWEYRVSSSELSVSSTLMILTWWCLVIGDSDSQRPWSRSVLR